MNTVICRLKKGEQAAFKELYESYKSKLYFFCLKYVKSEEIAKDILQETFVKIWDLRSNLDENQNFDSFIFTLIKHRLINYIKSEAIRKGYEDESLKQRLLITNETENGVIFNDYTRLLDEAINTMPVKRKEVYTLSRQSGLTYDEIAKNLNISTNTVEIHIVKALRDIRSFMKKHAGDELSVKWEA